MGTKGKYITFKQVGVVETDTPSEKSESLCLSDEEAKVSRGLKEWKDIRKLSNNDLLSSFLDFTYIINRKEGERYPVLRQPLIRILAMLWRDLKAGIYG